MAAEPAWYSRTTRGDTGRYRRRDSVAVLEAQTPGPLCKGPARTLHPLWNQVVLAEPRCVVTVVHENVADGAGTLWDDRSVTRITRGEFRDVTHAHALVVAASEKRSARRGAKRGGVELVVPQSALRQPIEGRRGNRPAEGTGGTETSVIGHDQQDIRRTFRGGDGLGEVGCGFARLASDDAAELWLRDWKHRRTSLWRFVLT